MDQMKNNLQDQIKNYFTRYVVDPSPFISLYSINKREDYHYFTRNYRYFENNSQISFLPQHSYIKNIEHAYKLNEYEMLSVDASVLTNISKNLNSSANLKLENILNMQLPLLLCSISDAHLWNFIVNPLSPRGDYDILEWTRPKDRMDFCDKNDYFLFNYPRGKYGRFYPFYDQCSIFQRLNMHYGSNKWSIDLGLHSKLALYVKIYCERFRNKFSIFYEYLVDNNAKESKFPRCHERVFKPHFKTICYRGKITVEFQNENIIYKFKEFCCENLYDDIKRNSFRVNDYNLSKKEGKRVSILTQVELRLQRRNFTTQKPYNSAIPIVHNRFHAWVENDPIYI